MHMKKNVNTSCVHKKKKTPRDTVCCFVRHNHTHTHTHIQTYTHGHVRDTHTHTYTRTCERYTWRMQHKLHIWCVMRYTYDLWDTYDTWCVTYDALQQTATDCNRLQQTATDCNRLQQTATDRNSCDIWCVTYDVFSHHDGPKEAGSICLTWSLLHREHLFPDGSREKFQINLVDFEAIF